MSEDEIEELKREISGLKEELREYKEMEEKDSRSPCEKDGHDYTLAGTSCGHFAGHKTEEAIYVCRRCGDRKTRTVGWLDY